MRKASASSPQSEPILPEPGLAHDKSDLNKADIQALFTQYPRLRTNLRQVYQAVKAHEESKTGDAGRSASFVLQSTHTSKGSQSRSLEAGILALEAAAERDEAAEGLNAFTELISGKDLQSKRNA